MRDRLEFTVERCDDEAVVVCRGHDRTGTPVEFELDADSLHANLARQAAWALRAKTASDVLAALRRIGVDAFKAWMIVEELLPPPLEVDTSSTAAHGRADLGDEVLKRGDDALRQIGDGDR